MAPAAVPESLLKKRQRDEKWALEKTEKAAIAKKVAKDKRKVIFKKAEAYVKEYRSQVRATLLRSNRLLRREHSLLHCSLRLNWQPALLPATVVRARTRTSVLYRAVLPSSA